MENIAFNLEELFSEISERATSEGALSREEWNDIVDAVLDEKREFGEIHDDDDWEQMTDALKSRFSDFSTEEVEEM